MANLLLLFARRVVVQAMSFLCFPKTGSKALSMFLREWSEMNVGLVGLREVSHWYLQMKQKKLIKS